MAQTMVEHWTHAGPVVAPDDVSGREITRDEVRTQATIGDAAPLGLLGFATGTFTLSAIATGLFSAGDIPYAVPVVLIFAGIAQFIAGLLMLRKGDTFAATAFGAFGAFNAVFAMYELTLHPVTLGGTPTAAPIVGIWIACFSYISLMLFVGALHRNAALSLVLLTLAATYGFMAASIFYPAGTVLLNIAGWCGIASSILAFYVATATVINSESQMPVMPLGSMHPAARNGHTPMHTGSTVVHETTVRETVH
jgi:uncharacterized protein